jgi:hypothetical protein
MSERYPMGLDRAPRTRSDGMMRGDSASVRTPRTMAKRDTNGTGLRLIVAYKLNHGR